MSCNIPIVRCLAVDRVLAEMTDLGESRAALHLGLRASLGAVAVRGEGDGPMYPSLARPHHSQDNRVGWYLFYYHRRASLSRVESAFRTFSSWRFSG